MRGYSFEPSNWINAELYRWRFLDVAGDERLDYSAHRMKLALVEIHVMLCASKTMLGSWE